MTKKTLHTSCSDNCFNTGSQLSSKATTFGFIHPVIFGRGLRSHALWTGIIKRSFKCLEGCMAKPRYIQSCQLCWKMESREIGRWYITELSVNRDLEGKSFFDGCPLVTIHLEETRLQSQCYCLPPNPSCEPVRCSHPTQLTRPISAWECCAQSPYTLLPGPVHFFSGVLNLLSSIHS